MPYFSLYADTASEKLEYPSPFETASKSTDTSAATLHYNNFGKSEGRVLDTFDATQYLANYSDLGATFGTNSTAAIQHYISHGFAEGRTDRTLLSTSQALNYIASHSDLITAFGSDTDRAISHYINYGQAEGRALNTFKPMHYLANYKDLSNAFGKDSTSALRHYINYGYEEGRTDIYSFGNNGGFISISTSPVFNSNEIKFYIGLESHSFFNHSDFDLLFNVNGGSISSITALAGSEDHIRNNSKPRPNTTFFPANSDWETNPFWGTPIDTGIPGYIRFPFYRYYEGIFKVSNPSTYQGEESITMSSSQYQILMDVGPEWTGGSNKQFGDTFDADSILKSRELTELESLNYLASYGDLINDFGNDTTAAANHYQSYGHQERRDLDNFDEWGYLASNNDLMKAFGSNTTEAIKHYISYGLTEGRGTDGFNAESYLNINSDVKSAFGNDQTLATKHYVESGFSEGRVF